MAAGMEGVLRHVSSFASKGWQVIDLAWKWKPEATARASSGEEQAVQLWKEDRMPNLQEVSTKITTNETHRDEHMATLSHPSTIRCLSNGADRAEADTYHGHPLSIPLTANPFGPSLSSFDSGLMAHLRESLNLRPPSEDVRSVRTNHSQGALNPNIINHARRRMAAEEKIAEEARANAVLDDLDRYFAPTIKPGILDSGEDSEDETR